MSNIYNNSLGNNISNIINEKQSHHNNTSTVDLYKHYYIPSQLPDNGKLTISVYDYNLLFSDKLIGSIAIDIEDRYFNSEWNNYYNVEHCINKITSKYRDIY